MNTAIYYPHLYPAPKWLRVAALCWDTVYTLVPSDAPPRPPGIDELDVGLGGVLESIPFANAISNRAIIDEFGDWVERHAPTFRARQTESAESAPFGESLANLYPSKMGGIDAPIVKRLVGLGLARVEEHVVENEMPDWEAESWGVEFSPPPPRPGTPHWKYEQLMKESLATKNSKKAARLRDEAAAIRRRHLVKVRDHSGRLLMPQDLALHYLALCASYVAEHRRTDLAASADSYASIAISGGRSSAGAIAQTLLKAHLPADLENVEPARLAHVRNSLRHERHAFQGQIEDLVREVEGIASEGQMEKLRQNAVELATMRANATRQAYRRANLTLAVEVMGLSLAPPALLATTTSLLTTGLFAPVAVAAALTTATARAFLAWRERGDTRRKAEWSYVFEVGRLL